MKQVAHIHIPRNAGHVMYLWARRNMRGNFQQLYAPMRKRRSRIDKSGKNFSPNCVWTYVGHSCAKDLLSDGVITQEWWNQVFKFAFVRNTYQRLVSLFEFERTRKFRRTKGHWTNAILLHFHDYINYLTSGERSSIQPEGTRQWPNPAGHRQLPWLETGVDFIGRHEHLDEDWETLCEIVGIEYSPLRHLNRPHEHLDLRSRLIGGWRGYYTDELRQKVREFYADEIEQFGFEF